MVVRGLASHRRGLGSIPESGITCRLNFLLVLGPSCRYSEGFYPCSLSTKTKESKASHVAEIRLTRSFLI